MLIAPCSAYHNHQPMGLAGGWRDEVWEALHENTACTGRMPAHQLPHHQKRAVTALERLGDRVILDRMA
jgi:hypothetical protein